MSRPKGKREVPQCDGGEMAERVSRALLEKGCGGRCEVSLSGPALVGSRIHAPAEAKEVPTADESREPDIGEAEVPGLGSSEDRGQIGRVHPVTVGAFRSRRLGRRISLWMVWRRGHPL